MIENKTLQINSSSRNKPDWTGSSTPKDYVAASGFQGDMAHTNYDT